MEIRSVLLLAGIIFLVMILPVMLAARLVQARHQGLFAAGLALLVAAAVEFVIATLFVDNTVSFLVQVGIMGFVFSQILGTDYLRGLAVSLMWGVFSVGIVMVLGMIGVSGRVLAG